MALFRGEDVGEKECIGTVGYVNENLEHALLTFINPALVNAMDRTFVQIAISVEGALTLRAELNAFLKNHGVLPQ